MHITTDIIINTPPQRVWDILIAFEAYARWNPFITSIEGHIQPGERLKIKTEMPNGKGFSFKPTILVANPPHELTWIGSLGIKGLFDGTHTFRLEALKDSKTKLIHSETFQGILVPLFRKMLLAQTEASFHRMNVALKKHAEA